MNVLGISAYFHDSAAALVSDGEVIAAAQEERFSRVKHDASFPLQSVRYCLAEAARRGFHIDAIAFYEKPITKFSRILETYLSVAPRGLRSFVMAMPLWGRSKLWIPLQIESAMEKCGVSTCPPLYFPEHHVSHAASAFYPSPFEHAALLTIDGVGEWSTTTLGVGSLSGLEIVKELRFPHSLGLLFSAFTYFVGFRVNSGEYKLMGLAPYGKPRYADLILNELIDLKADGSFRLNMRYFGYLDGLTMTNKRFAELFGGPERQPESVITQREMDLACSIQAVTEEIVWRLALHAKELTACENLCLAGGVGLNCVSNGKLSKKGLFKNIWVQPAAGDAGGALGAALAVGYGLKGSNWKRTPKNGRDGMKGCFLGPDFSSNTIRSFLDARGYPYHVLSDEQWSEKIAECVDAQKVVGLFQGRMEYGPRALGARSIIGDARSPDMQSIMNLKIKNRESFRPFAPACLEERLEDYFEINQSSPYMLFVTSVQAEHRKEVDVSDGADLSERLRLVRSSIPAVTHVDYTARVQSVSAQLNGPFHDIIKAFEKRTGCGVIINTSFNVRGEPIVATPEDAYRCFMRTGMDVLVLEDCLLLKEEQGSWDEADTREKELILD